MSAPTTRAARRLLLAILAAFLGLGAALPASAETKLVNLPADKFVTAPGGVDMRTGRFVYSETELSAGPLALTRTMPERVANHANPFGNFSHNWDIFLLETRTDLSSGNSTGSDYRMNVHHSGRSFTFDSRSFDSGFIYKSDGTSARLTYSGGDRSSGTAVYTYESGGTVLTFRPIGGSDCADQAWGSGRRRCAFVSEMIEPDGTRYTFQYVSAGGDTGNLVRLSRVTSSLGYALLLEGSGHRVTKACVLNLALSSVPANGLCPANALAAAAYSYEPGGRLAQAIGPDSSASGFTYSAAPEQAGTIGFVKPGQAAPWLTNHIRYERDEEDAPQEITGGQSFADGQSYSYGFATAPMTNNRPVPAIVGGSYADAEGRVTAVNYDFPIAPESGPPTTCMPPPCNFEMPDDGLDYVYQQTPGPVEIVDPLGRRTVMNYCDPAKLLVAEPYGGCEVTTLQWWTDPEGIKTVLEYDLFRNITKATRHPKPGVANPDGSIPAPIVTSATYDTANPRSATRPRSMTDALGRTTTWTYAPEHGGVLTETGPAVNGVNPQKRYSYVPRTARLLDGSAAGPPVWLLDRMSTCWTGNPSGAGCALGAADEVATTYDYGPDSASNNLLLRGQAVTADGQTFRTCFAYDGLGRKISETSPNGTVGLSSCPYTAPTTALPHTTSTRYDAGGRVTGTIAPDPDGAGWLPHPAVRNTYDAAGRLIRVEHGGLFGGWQANGVAPAHWPSFTVQKYADTTYDALDRKTREAPVGHGVLAAVTEYGYDLGGRLKCTAVRMNPDVWATPLADKCVPGPAHPVHGADRISKIVYDAAGQPIESWDGVATPLQRREAHYTYNGNGQKLALTDARGFRAEMTYDGHGRQSRWIFPSKTGPGVADQADYEQYLYDPNGNRTSLRKRDGSVLTFQYDALNRMTAKLVPGGAGNVGYTYDLRGLQTSANFVTTGGGVTNVYDGFGRLASTTTHIGGSVRTVSHQYDREGREVERTFPDGQKFWTARDGLGRMISGYHGALGDTSVGMTVFHYDWTSYLYYFGRRWGSASYYEHGPSGRLSRLDHSFNTAPGQVRSDFLYNPAGQLSSETRTSDSYAWTGSVAVSRPYSVNGQNQYTAAGPASFTYDLNGNLTSDGTTSFVYDVENRLVRASGALPDSKNATLVYDPLGRLFQISSPATGTTQFLYDGDELASEYNSAGTMLRRYVHGDSDDDPLYWFEGAGFAAPRFPHANHQGSIVSIAEPGGVLLSINTYDEYGVPGLAQRTASALGSHGRFQYTGQAWLPELGMYYYKARIYSPGLGRFLQIDPIGYEDGLNIYAYVGNDPVNAADPSGLKGEAPPCNTAATRICPTGQKDGGNQSTRSGRPSATGRAATGIAAAARAAPLASTLLLCGDTPTSCGPQQPYWYLTYTKTKGQGAGAVVYSGRTAGPGSTPQEVLARRDSRHHMNGQGFGRARLDRALETQSTAAQVGAKTAIRGREQMLIDHHGGARSQGGTSGNAINGISDYNPLKGIYIGAARMTFGDEFD